MGAIVVHIVIGCCTISDFCKFSDSMELMQRFLVYTQNTWLRYLCGTIVRRYVVGTQPGVKGSCPMQLGTNTAVASFAAGVRR